MQNKIQVPERSEVSENNQALFDNLNSALGFVPNLYAVMAHSENGLANYLQFQNAKSSLTKKEKEVINLVVSEVNECVYCQSAHTVVGKLNGFSDEQILAIREGSAPFNEKLDALARLTKTITINRGSVDEETLAAFFEAGYDKGNLVDVVNAIADKVVMNYLFKITQIPIDFPLAPQLTKTV